MVKLVFLTQKFYSDYAHCSEIENKPMRPHVQIIATYNGNLFCIPMRSNIRHPHCILTDPVNHCGIDFSKAVVITDPTAYINYSTTPYLRPGEFNVLKGINPYDIEKGLEKYIKTYKKAKAAMHVSRNAMLVSMSTLQYFEKYI